MAKIIPDFLNIARTSRLRQEAEEKQDWVGEYAFGMFGIVQGFMWGAILGIPAFTLGAFLFWRLP